MHGKLLFLLWVLCCQWQRRCVLQLFRSQIPAPPGISFWQFEVAPTWNWCTGVWEYGTLSLQCTAPWEWWQGQPWLEGLRLLVSLLCFMLWCFFKISFNITFLVGGGRGCLNCKAHPVLFYKWAFWASECKKMQKKSDTEIMWNKTRVIFCIFWSAKYWEKTLFWANINILLRIYRHIIWEYEHISSEVTFEVWSLCRYRIPVAEIPVLLSSMRQVALLEILWYVIYWLK